ncbi:MAG: hypothetical protein IK954_04605 [Clostridia bacterium]|nr:hypothetical protein [Clostridia bacterium]
MNIIVNATTQKAKHKPSLLTIERLCALYVVLWIFVPPIQIGTIYRLLAIICAFIWLFCVSLQNKDIFSDLKRYLSFAIPYIILLFFARMFTYSLRGAITPMQQTIIIIVCGVMATYYMRHDKDFVRVLLTVSMIAIAFFCVTTIQGLIVDPYASRIANSEWLNGRFEGNENVGLYGYIYMCVLLAPMLLYLLINRIKVNRLFNAIVVVDFILISAMSFLSGYMIAIFCYLIGCGLILAFNKRNAVYIFLFVTAIICLLLFYQQILSAIFDLLLDIFGKNIAYYEKICNIRDLFLNGDVTGITVKERWSDYTGSIRDIFRYPIFGSYLFGSSGAGGHSSVLDAIGKSGWLLSYLYFFILWKYPFEIYQAKFKNATLRTIIFVVILFGIFDPYTQEICIPLYLFFPYILYLADQQIAQCGDSSGPDKKMRTVLRMNHSKY